MSIGHVHGTALTPNGWLVVAITCEGKNRMKPIKPQFQVNVRISEETARQLEQMTERERRSASSIAHELLQIGMKYRTLDRETTTAREPQEVM